MEYEKFCTVLAGCTGLKINGEGKSVQQSAKNKGHLKWPLKRVHMWTCVYDLLQQYRLIVQYTSINNNAELLSSKHNIHEVHILWWMIFRSLYNLQTARHTTQLHNGNGMYKYSSPFWTYKWRGSATGRAMDLRSVGRGFKSYLRQHCVTILGKLFTPMCLCHQAV